MESKAKCWELFQCKETECPVYTLKKPRCWLVSGTHCREEIQGKFLEKIEMCLECESFRDNIDVDSMEETLGVVNRQFIEFRKMVEERDKELEDTSMELALGLSEVFEALKEISLGDPLVRIPETSKLELISKLKHMVNLTAENQAEIVELSHEFAIGLAEHFDALHRVSRGDLAARVSGTSQVELLEHLKKVTNHMIQSVSAEITERKRAEEALRTSEERFRQMAGLSPFPISIIESDGRYLYTNKKFTELFGYTLDDVPTGRDWFRKAHPDSEYRREVISFWKSDLEKSEKYQVRLREFRVVCKDGTVRDIMFRPVSMDRGRQFVTYEDLTDRKRAGEALRESEARYRSVFENTGTAMMIIEDDTTLSMVNTEFEELSGYSKEEVEGRMSWTEFVVKEDLERMKKYHVKRRRDELKAPKEYEFGFVDKHGKIRNISNRVGMIPGTKRSAAALTDITSRKQAEEKLHEMFRQIKKGYDDHLSILNMLRLGIATIDRDGSVTFLNQTAQQLVGQNQEAVVGRHWEDVFSFREHDRARLIEIMKRPAKTRKKLQAQVAFDEGRHYWMDIEVQDDPPNPERKILFLYDMTEVYDLRRMLEDKARFHDIVGKSGPMQSVYRRIQEVSKVDWTVLIEGNTGTGKELVARAIHSSSHRREKSFIAVNCAGLTDSLLTSQLFGHKRGAFTGAVEDHKGLFEVANGGTLLLDEIGDISKSMQTSLLRVLEEKEITRLGESKPRRIDVRVLAATHRNLSEEVEKGRFRPDLLYRIRIARIQLPLLYERREDIPLLVGTFLGQSRAATGKSVKGVSNEAMRILLQYDWPGNVRELKSAIDFATLHCKGSVIRAEDLPSEIVTSKHEQLEDVPPADPYQDEKQRILAALDSAKGNRTVAARLLGMSRATLYRRLASLEVEPAT